MLEAGRLLPLLDARRVLRVARPPHAGRAALVRERQPRRALRGLRRDEPLQRVPSARLRRDASSPADFDVVGVPAGSRRRPARHPPASQTDRSACVALARATRALAGSRISPTGGSARSFSSLLALAVYAVRAIGWPLVGGRDLDEYLYDYVQFLDWHPLLPWSMLFRTPVRRLVDGAALDVAGGFFAEPLMAVLFAGSVVAWAAAARGVREPRGAARRRRAARVPGLRPDVPRGLERADLRRGVLALGIARRARGGSTRRSRASRSAGLGVALLALIRPGNAVLLAFVALPARARGSSSTRVVKRRPRSSSPALVPLVAWAVLNGVRFGDYALARGGNAVIPFYRAFITDKIVSPDNGPASRRLARRSAATSSRAIRTRRTA